MALAAGTRLGPHEIEAAIGAARSADLARRARVGREAAGLRDDGLRASGCIWARRGRPPRPIAGVVPTWRADGERKRCSQGFASDSRWGRASAWPP